MKLAILSADEINTTAKHFGDVYLDHVVIDVHTSPKDLIHEKYDIILWIDPCDFLPENIKTFTGLKIAYFIDTHRAMFKRKIIARCFDIIFVAQKKAVSSFKHSHRVYWLPLAYNDKYKFENTKKKFEVSFIGNTNHQNSNRGRDVSQILEQFIHPKTNGYHFSDMLRIYSQSKIVLNKTIGGELNMRFFEGIGAGAVVLTDQSKECTGKLFTHGEDFVSFSSPKEAVKKIQIILANYDEYQLFAKTAQENVLTQHTYKNRILEILSKSHGISPKVTNGIDIGLFYLATNNLDNFHATTFLLKIWKYVLLLINQFRILRNIFLS